MAPEKRLEVKRLLQDGPLSHQELAEHIHGCECGKVTISERRDVSRTVRELHRDNEVNYTLDRRVELTDSKENQ